MIVKSKSVNDSDALAIKLAKYIKGGNIVFLNGDLGAGKTTFVKALAKALNVKEPVTSPTFTLLKTYDTAKFTIVHVDAYRLEGSSFDELIDYLSDENVIFIEWSKYLTSLDLIKDYLTIDIRYISKNQREFIISAVGQRSIDLLKEIEND